MGRRRRVGAEGGDSAQKHTFDSARKHTLKKKLIEGVEDESGERTLEALEAERDACLIAVINALKKARRS